MSMNPSKIKSSELPGLFDIDLELSDSYTKGTFSLGITHNSYSLLGMG